MVRSSHVWLELMNIRVWAWADDCLTPLLSLFPLSRLLSDPRPQHRQLRAASDWLQQESDSSLVGPSPLGAPGPVHVLLSGPVQGGAAGLGVLGGGVDRRRRHRRLLQQHLKRRRHGELPAGTQRAVVESGVFRGKLHAVSPEQEVQILLTTTLQPQSGSLPGLVYRLSVFLLRLSGRHGPPSHLLLHLHWATLPGVLGLGLRRLGVAVSGGVRLGATAAVMLPAAHRGAESSTLTDRA